MESFLVFADGSSVCIFCTGNVSLYSKIQGQHKRSIFLALAQYNCNCVLLFFLIPEMLNIWREVLPDSKFSLNCFSSFAGKKKVLENLSQ